MGTATSNIRPPPAAVHYCRVSTLFAFLFLQHLLYAAASAGEKSPSPLPSTYAFSEKFTPATVIVVVGVFGAFLSFGSAAVFMHNCSGSRGSRRVLMVASAGDSGQGQTSAGLGLDPALIQKLPTFEYAAVRGLRIGAEELECAVCIAEFAPDETLRLLPKCDHAFHPDCIDAWLLSHTTCPVCRSCVASLSAPETQTETETEAETETAQVAVAISVPDPDRNSEPESPAAHEPRNRNATFQIPAVDSMDQSGVAMMVSGSGKERSRGTFPRSHTTGHSLVGQSAEAGQDKIACDEGRFALRLPADVREELINSSLNRTRSCVAFRTVRSSRRGYRNGGVWGSRGRGSFNYERFDRVEKPDRCLSPAFLSRTRSAKVSAGSESALAKSFFRSMSDKLLLDRPVGSRGSFVEGSTDPLRSKIQV